MFGNGSDGAFNHTSGTTTLALDTKHQFTTFNVASGARLEASGVGSVLYITATESISIDGTVVAWNTQRGQNSLSVTIDGVTYTSPGTANGGKGGDNTNTAGVSSGSSLGGVQGSGFGGGGAGGDSVVWRRGGSGGAGGSTPGSGGAGGGPASTVDGYPGGTSAGGGGGTDTVNSRGGTGGNAYGNNGIVPPAQSSRAGGGGGAGGQAARPGVHTVLRAPTIIINGAVVTCELATRNGGAGGSGGAGINGGRSGSGGGGGGGANAGNLHLIGAELDYDTATLSLSGGTGGPGGSGYQAGASGANGTDGVLHVTSIIPAQPYPGPFYRVWDGTEWIYASGKVRDATAFKETKAEVL